VIQQAVPIAALIIALAWIPVLLRFFRSWRARGNPISLAICLLVIYALYAPVYLAFTLPPSWSIAALGATDFITCVTFYSAVYAAAKRFPDTRSAQN
jgi:O-antigen ligase